MNIRRLGVSLGAVFSLIACGGGGSDGAVGNDSTSSMPAGASAPAANQGQALSGTTYVGHWYGVDAINTPTQFITHVNAGGMVLHFAQEAPGKVRALGQADVLGRITAPPPTWEKFTLGVGMVGDLYADNNLILRGTGQHVFDTTIFGQYDPATRGLSLLAYRPQGAKFGFPCRFGVCEGEYYAPERVHAVLSPLGSSQPADLTLSFEGKTAKWPSVPGVAHWLVSVYRKDTRPHPGMGGGLGEESYEPALFPFASTANLDDIEDPTNPCCAHDAASYFFDRMLLAGNKLSAELSRLESGKTYIVALTGFKTQKFAREHIVYTSGEFTAP